VAIAEPNYIHVKMHTPNIHQPSRPVSFPSAFATGADPLIGQQWAARKTQAIEAWASGAIGDPSIVIAIIDEGVDTSHEDLKDVITKPYDAVEDDTVQDPNSWDGHGTACAGLAAAIPNNSIGIRGFGGGCKIMPIRMAYSPVKDGDWITSDEIIARAVNFAWKNGAHILSNSWGGGLISDVEEVAWNNALKLGRGGKGCIILAAAGNSAGKVIAPANYPPIFCISASNNLDTFKRRNDGSSEYWWGSCYGPEVLIAAPGVQNITTDVSGGGGYDPSNYDSTFNGTSSATPIAAGVVGLLLSINPEATTDTVKQILKDSADKVGNDAYVNGRNNFMGYGRLNVLRAVNLMREKINQPVINTEVVGIVEKLPGKIFLLNAGDTQYAIYVFGLMEAQSWQSLLDRNKIELTPFIGKKVKVNYLMKQEDSLYGCSLSAL